MPSACLYRGQIMHCRMRPFRHRFVYRVVSILLDIDRPDERPATRLFSIGRPNLFSWYPADHGPRDGSALRPWLDERLRLAGRPWQGRSAWLSCFPRMLGSGFDPLSVYFVQDGPTLETIVYEVKNTFGRQHAYVVAVGDARSGFFRHSVDKAFFVSPFIGMTARYHMKTALPGEQLALSIRQTVPEGLQLLVSQRGQRRPLSDAELLKASLWAGPMAFKVEAGIHWEAAKLWRKGARFRGPASVSTEEGGTGGG